MMLQRSKDHLQAAGETYFEHMRFALVVGLVTAGAALACIIHAIVPALCERTCSRTLGQLRLAFCRPSAPAGLRAAGVRRLHLRGADPARRRHGLGPRRDRRRQGPDRDDGLLAFAIPFTFLSTNPELESVEAD
jgi:hypothetical protein